MTTLDMLDKAEHAMCGGHVHTEVVSKAIVREWLRSIRATIEPARAPDSDALVDPSPTQQDVFLAMVAGLAE